MIDPPPRAPDYPDAEMDCQAAIEDAFRALAAEAEAAGWYGGQVSIALLALSTAYIKARMGMVEADRAIRAAQDSVGEQ